MFDAGWILPPSSRRGGRAPMEVPDTPPRKRQRTSASEYSYPSFASC